jgi:hypothetical protein
MQSKGEDRMQSNENGDLRALGALVGTWETEATHPVYPGLVVAGRAVVEWLEGGKFLIQRTWTEHPEFPDAIAIIGNTSDVEGLSMHYFDSRGVFRIYQVRADDRGFAFWRDSPGFDQRFSGTYRDDGKTMVGRSQLRRDGSTWHDDLEITYRRVG